MPWGTVYVKEADSALFDAEDCVVNERVIAGHFRGEINHCSSTCRNECCLHAVGRRADQIGLAVDVVKDLADNMERRNQIRPAVTEENPHLIPGLCLDGIVTN